MSIRTSLTAVVVAFFTATSAYASDHGSSPFNGCYFGAHGGYASQTVELEANPGTLSLGVDGGFVGLQGGCDVAVSNSILLGAYGEFNWYSADEDNLGLAPIELDTKWSVGGRAGVLLNPGTLVYGKLGFTKGKGENTDASGIDMGAGLEISLGGGLFLQAEGVYTRWNDQDVTVLNVFQTEADQTQISGRVGMLYKFAAPAGPLK